MRYTVTVEINIGFQKVGIKSINILLIFLVRLHAEMIIFWIYWVKQTISLKLILPVSFLLFKNMPTRKLKIT